MRDRRWDWALGASNAANKQAQEDMEAMDCLNTAMSGYGKAEQKERDWSACWFCEGHGCKKCNGSGYSEWYRK